MVPVQVWASVHFSRAGGFQATVPSVNEWLQTVIQKPGTNTVLNNLWNWSCTCGRVVEGSRLLICRGVIPIESSNLSACANNRNKLKYITIWNENVSRVCFFKQLVNKDLTNRSMHIKSKTLYLRFYWKYRIFKIWLKCMRLWPSWSGTGLLIRAFEQRGFESHRTYQLLRSYIGNDWRQLITSVF